MTAQQIIQNTVSEKPERIFTVYKSTIENQKLIKKDGGILVVRNYRYITDKQSEIEFIDAEISNGGFATIRKLGTATAAELDPMAEMKAKIIAEYEAEKAAKLAAMSGTTQGLISPISKETKQLLPDNLQVQKAPPSVGHTVSESAPQKLNPASTDKLASLLKNSNAAK